MHIKQLREPPKHIDQPRRRNMTIAGMKTKIFHFIYSNYSPQKIYPTIQSSYFHSYIDKNLSLPPSCTYFYIYSFIEKKKKPKRKTNHCFNGSSTVLKSAHNRTTPPVIKGEFGIPGSSSNNKNNNNNKNKNKKKI